MIDREYILKKARNDDDRLLLSKIADKAARTERSNYITYSDFMDPYQMGIVDKAFEGYNDLLYSFSGGFDGAERVIILFRPNFMSEEDVEYPLKVLYLKHDSRVSLSHRDYLGSLMGLGIKREKIGDILVKEESCQIVVMSDIVEYIGMQLSNVGSTSVEVNIRDIDEIDVPQKKLKEINSTVASMRLDSIAGIGFGISRSKIAEFIKSDRVSLNWVKTDNTAKAVKEGDTISIKGKGRVEVSKVGGTTKKGRINISLKKYI